VEVSLKIKNEGKGSAEKVRVDLISRDANVIIAAGSVDLGTLKSGSTKKVRFVVTVNKRFSREKVSLTVGLEESRKRFSRQETLEIPVDRAQQDSSEITEISVEGDYTEEEIRIKTIPGFLRVSPAKISVAGKTVGEIELPEKDKLKNQQ